MNKVMDALHVAVMFVTAVTAACSRPSPTGIGE